MCCCSRVEGQGSGGRGKQHHRGSQRGPLLVTYCNTADRTKRWLSKNIQITKVDEQHRTIWELEQVCLPPTEQA